MKKLPKVRVTTDDFVKIENGLKSIGFREISEVEFKTTFRRLALKAPRSKPGREIGFIYQSNGLTVIVWTTFLVGEYIARDSDLGWVLIAKGDTAQYFAHPFRRTKNFARNILCHAWLAQFRIKNRPLCPECHRYMEITRGKGLKSRYWSCKNNKAHAEEKPTTDSWDRKMQPKAQKFIKAERRARAKYIKKRRANGQTTHQAMLARKPWQTRNPANKI